MIDNQVIRVSKEKYLEKLNRENEEFIAKVELGRTVNTNVENMQKIFKEIGYINYKDIVCSENNYDAINDYLSDISSLKNNRFQALEIYIYNENNLDSEIKEILIENAKDHEYNVAIHSSGSQIIMSFDIYILDTKISE